MEFRLIFEGPLPPESCDGHNGDSKRGRAKEKQQLRKHFHKQLRELWKQHPSLRHMAEGKFVRYKETGKIMDVTWATEEGSRNAKSWLDIIADDHPRLGTKFVPLVSKEGGFTCSLDILFLRRDNPGSLITEGGDIDNRIKVLFDGLRMPDTFPELGGLPIDGDENPFYCLLEDDSLITSVSVTTDRFIAEVKPGESPKNIFLIIHVKMTDPSEIFRGGRLP